MTLIFLVRHGVTDQLGHTLVGRMPGVALNEEGERQARRVALRLTREAAAAVYSSPIQRTRQTAEPIAAAAGCPLEIVSALNEVDVGAWTGLGFAYLRKDNDWKLWNAFRGGGRAGGGESMLEVQSRVVGFIEDLRRRQEAPVVLVSHGDPIKSALVYYLGMGLDSLHRLEVAPASISAIRIETWGPRVVLLNETVPEPP